MYFDKNSINRNYWKYWKKTNWLDYCYIRTRLVSISTSRWNGNDNIDCGSMYLHHQKCKKHVAQYTSMKNICSVSVLFLAENFPCLLSITVFIKRCSNCWESQPEINVNSNQSIVGAVSLSTQCLPEAKFLPCVLWMFSVGRLTSRWRKGEIRTLFKKHGCEKAFTIAHHQNPLKRTLLPTFV